MDDWSGLRTAAVVVVWATVAGGLVLGSLWFVFGGGRSVGPEDETLAEQAEPIRKLVSCSRVLDGSPPSRPHKSACTVCSG